MRTLGLVVLAVIATINFLISTLLLTWQASASYLTFTIGNYAYAAAATVFVCASWYVIVRRLPERAETLYLLLGYGLVALGIAYLSTT